MEGDGLAAVAVGGCGGVVERRRARACGRPGGAPGLVDEGGVEVDHDDAAVGGDGAELSSVRLRGWSVRARAEEWEAMMGARGGGEGVPEGLVGDVGDVDHHAEAVHLADDVVAEGGEAVVVGDGGVVEVAGGVGPVVGVGPGEGHVADAEAVVEAEEAEGVLDGVAAFDADEDGEAVPAAWAARMSSGVRQRREVVGVAADLLEDGVDELRGCGGRSGRATAVGSTQMAKNSAARLPARAVSRLRWPWPRGSVKSQASSTKRWGVSAWVSMTRAAAWIRRFRRRAVAAST